MNRRLAIGIDVGGSKILSGLVDERGNIIATDRRHTEAARGSKAVLRNIKDSMAAVRRSGVSAIGVGIAGSVDAAKGVFRQGPNFHSTFRNIGLKDLVRKEFGVPAVVDNDVHCFTLGEAIFGAGMNARTVVGLTLGTGIGGGIVMDEAIVRGKNNTAGEIGHITIDHSSERVCSCGKLGHLEALASGPAMAERYAERSGRHLAAFWDFEELASAGDPDASAVAKEAAAYLGAGIASVLHMVDPDLIVIGGGAAKIRLIWQGLKREIKKNIAYPSLFMTSVVKSELGDNANILGAAYLARGAERQKKQG